jgi:hypothetical protein
MPIRKIGYADKNPGYSASPEDKRDIFRIHHSLAGGFLTLRPFYSFIRFFRMARCSLVAMIYPASLIQGTATHVLRGRLRG